MSEQSVGSGSYGDSLLTQAALSARRSDRLRLSAARLPQPERHQRRVGAADATIRRRDSPAAATTPSTPVARSRRSTTTTLPAGSRASPARLAGAHQSERRDSMRRCRWEASSSMGHLRRSVQFSHLTIGRGRNRLPARERRRGSISTISAICWATIGSKLDHHFTSGMLSFKYDFAN